MNLEKKPQFDLSYSERRLIDIRAKLAKVQLEMIANHRNEATRGLALGQESFPFMYQCIVLSRFVIEKLNLTIPLIDGSILNMNGRIDYRRVINTKDPLPHNNYGLWHSGSGLDVPQPLTPDRITQLREKGDRPVAIVDSYTPIQLANRFIDAIESGRARL